MTLVLSAGCAAMAVWLLVGRSPGAARARRALTPPATSRWPADGITRGVGASGRYADAGPGPPPVAAAAGGTQRFHRPVAVLAGLALALVLGGPVGVVAGTLGAVGLYRWLAGLETRERRRRRERLAAELPVAADLLAACLCAGSAFDSAAAAVADALEGPLREVLLATVATLRLGGDPAQCWRALERDEVLAPLGRALARAAETGAPVADAALRLAEEQRRERRWAAESAARKIGVQAVAPLGLCFLPAFVLLAIVPVVGGIAADVLPALR